MTEHTTILAIASMAIATYLTRVLGYLLLSGRTVRGRQRAALDALAPAILMAVIAPTVFATGAAETLAAGVAAAAAIFRLPLIAVLIAGVTSVVAFRMIGG
jgi:uncharacterized membrane protein